MIVGLRHVSRRTGRAGGAQEDSDALDDDVVEQEHEAAEPGLDVDWRVSVPHRRGDPQMPCQKLCEWMASTVTVVPTLPDLMRTACRAFSSGLSHCAVRRPIASKPHLGRLRRVGHGEVADDAEAHGDHAVDKEEHAPVGQRADRLELEDACIIRRAPLALNGP